MFRLNSVDGAAIRAMIDWLQKDADIHSVTHFKNAHEVIRVTRQGKKLDHSSKQHTFLVTVGRPNYNARHQLKMIGKKAIGKLIPLR